MTRQRLDAIARGWAVLTVVGWALLLALVFGTVSNARAAQVEMNDRQQAPVLERRRDAPQTTVEAVETTVMCPSCDSTLDQSDSPAAQRMRAWVVAAVEAGWTEQEIRDGLVAEYGGDESVLATPRARGAGLAVWVVPAIIALVAITGGVLMLRRWKLDARAARSAAAGDGGAAGQTRSASSSSSHASSSSASASPSGQSSPD